MTICLHCDGNGCYRCCTRCNTDTHRCPGCGKPVIHGYDVCLKCRNMK